MATQGRASSQMGSPDVMTAYKVGSQPAKKKYACSPMIFDMVIILRSTSGEVISLSS